MEGASRVFVKGLPPSFAENDFRNHFSKRYTITDVKLFPHRRIGYVGFKTPQDASAAIKYFNKSFIRMSRISVELADNNLLRPQILHPTSRTRAGSAATAPKQTSPGSSDLKRKREEARQDAKDPKLDEFLGLMRPPSKLKAWSDETIPVDAVQSGNTLGVDLSDTTPDRSSNNLDVSNRRSMNIPDGVESVKPTSTSVKPEVPSDSMLYSSQDNDKRISAESLQHENTTQQQLEPGQATDIDWMRSRTSRLLGLIEDDEVVGGSNPGKLDVRSASPEDTTMLEHPPDLILNSSNGEDIEEVEMDRDDTADQTKEIRESGRLYIRNLAYTVSAEELKELFSQWTSLEETHIPVDPRTEKAKGFAFVQFTNHDHAAEAYEKLDGTVFQGRLLHIVPGAARRESKMDEFALSKLPLKKQKQIQRKVEASKSIFNWNSMYMNADAVLSSTAARLGVSKSELLDPTASDAAVKQAQAETHVIQETKAYFEANGVDLTSFNNRERGDNPILVKNFTYGTKAEDLRALFSAHGDVSRVLMPPTGTIAIVEFKEAIQGKAAFKALAYKKLNDSMLFLEKAPPALFKGLPQGQISDQSLLILGQAPKPSTSDLLYKSVDDEVVDVSTLYVSNISFSTTQERFREWAQPLNGFISAKLRTKADAKNIGKLLSLGSGFLEFQSADQARAALAAMNGRSLDGHNLAIKPAKKAYDVGEERRKEDAAKRNSQRKSKLIVKNLPFEISKKDITSLFKPYGALRVRVPKKFDSTRKGFAFVDFATPREAENAKDSMRDTHLLGRRLVMEYAAGDAEDPEKEIEKMQQKVGRQASSVAAQRLIASSERRKFNIGGDDEVAGG